MKKTIALLVTLIMLIGVFAACGGAAPTTPAPAPTPAPGATPPTQPEGNGQQDAGEIRVGIALPNHDDFTENLRGVYERMAPDFGITLNITNAGGDASTQISNVEALIAQRPDLIILRAVNAEIGDTLTEMIYDAGIPAIIDGHRPLTSALFEAHVVGNQYTHGRVIGEYLQAYLDANPGSELNLLFINGGTDEIVRRRMNGIFHTAPGVNLIGDELGAWSPSTAQEITEAYLISRPEMNVIGAANDEMALAVIEILRGAGRLDDIMVFGIDGSQSGQAAVRSGEMTGTSFNNVAITVDLIYQIAVMIINGEDFSHLFTDAERKEIDPGAFVLLTAGTIDEIIGS